MTDFPEELDEDPKAREEFREEWFENAADDLVDEDEISASDADDGSEPLSELDEEALDELDDEMMHVKDEFDDELHENMHEEDEA